MANDEFVKSDLKLTDFEYILKIYKQIWKVDRQKLLFYFQFLWLLGVTGTGDGKCLSGWL